jgi:hypothetical protein
MLARYASGKPKRQFVNSCTPCRELIPTIGCQVLCCQRFMVILSQEDLDDGLEVHAPFIDVLKRAPGGACQYLDEVDRTCTVWERRPLECRIFDCRIDTRFEALLKSWRPLRFGELPDRCHHCGREARLVAGSARGCDGYVVCADCGAPWRYQKVGPDEIVNLVAVQTSDATRARYRFYSLLYREQWAAALSELEAQMPGQDNPDGMQRQRGGLLAELGRFAEAEAALAPLAARGIDGGDDECQQAALDLAWVHTRTGHDVEARGVVEQLFPRMRQVHLVRAHLLLGNIAMRAGSLEEAARHYVAADTAATVKDPRKPVTLEHLQTFSSSSPEARAAVERQSLLRMSPAIGAKASVSKGPTQG